MVTPVTMGEGKGIIVGVTMLPRVNLSAGKRLPFPLVNMDLRQRLRDSFT